jgi:hypothetical protein
MGAYGGPDIVTDGLIFTVDAGSARSYPGTGTVATDLVGSKTGTLTNGVGFSSSNGGSWDFDGTDDYINFGVTGFNFGTGNFNVSCWIKTTMTSASYTGVIAKFNGSDSSGLWVQLTPTNKYVAFGWDGSNFLLSTTTPVNNGVWRHISCQRTGSTTAEIYVDGVLITSGAGSSASSDSTFQLDIGRINISGRYFDGDISNTMLYNKALSAAEILQNYNAQKNRFI